jgi:hypothetical protein
MASLDELVQQQGVLGLKMDELRDAWRAASKAVDDLPSDTPQDVMTAACAAHHEAFKAYEIAYAAFYDVFEKLTRCVSCEMWQFVEEAGDWTKGVGIAWCPNCAQHPCRACDEPLDSDQGEYCEECRPCECGECEVVGGTCLAQSAKY